MKSFLQVIFKNYSIKAALLAELEDDISFLVKYLPGIIGFSLRYAAYKFLFKKIESMPLIQPGVRILMMRNISLGKNVLINSGSYLYGRGGIEIGDNVLISPNCSIVAGTHSWDNPDLPIMLQPSKSEPIKINSDVWIGANVVIVGGVTIAEGSVIGAGAVVTKDTEPYSINVGIPAKKIGSRKK